MPVRYEVSFGRRGGLRRRPGPYPRANGINPAECFSTAAGTRTTSLGLWIVVERIEMPG